MEASSAERVLEQSPQKAERRLLLLSINDLPEVWPQVEPLLQRACEHSGGEYTPHAVLAGMGLYDGETRLHMLALEGVSGIESIMVTCFSRAPTGLMALECLLTGGREVSEWLPFEPLMDEWARDYGCSKVRIPRGRKGWLKALSHWRVAGYVLEREI